METVSAATGNSVFSLPTREQLSAIEARSTKRVVSLLDPKARAFTPGEKALIRKVHGYMPALQLLAVLNERLLCDAGPDAVRYTIEQLYAEIGAADVTPAVGHDWASLRRLVAKARREGVLAAVTAQVIEDFAAVFSLSSGQVLRLQDVLLRAKERDES